VHGGGGGNGVGQVVTVLSTTTVVNLGGLVTLAAAPETTAETVMNDWKKE